MTGVKLYLRILTTAVLAISAFSAPRFALGQESQDPWEGKAVADVREAGFKRQRWSELRQRLELRKGIPYDKTKRNRDLKALYAVGSFADVSIEPTIEADGRVVFTVTVIEFQPIQDIRFHGLNAISVATLKPLLGLNLGDMLNPYRLKLDRDAIREQLTLKGYHFSALREEIVDGDAGVVLNWRITEGPLVTVKKIEFTGNAHMESANLKGFMLNKEPSSFLLIPTGGEPFIHRNIEEDIKRIKLIYQQGGWLDITQGERVFVKDLLFNVDRTEVTIRIHIDEGPRYRIKRISFKGCTGRAVSEEKLASVLTSKVEEYYSDNSANIDMKKIRDLYGEQSFILATVEPEVTIKLDLYELDLEYKIVENQAVTVGRIIVQGNEKTRYDVILRELKDFVPGEKFNNQLLQKGVQRLKDRQYFEPGSGIQVRHEPGQEPGVRDVILDVKEGSTGQVRFAGGYSSSFGILGIIEFSQKNFDIADLPKSLEDMFSGNAFAGGGQQFTIRYAPSVGRQSFVVNFREPWLFGTEYGMSLRGFNIRTLRESWDEEKVGGVIGFDKRFDPFRVDVGINLLRYGINNIEPAAPSTVLELSGTNRMLSVSAGITYDTRNSALFTTSGQRVSLSYEWAGDPLPGDFDFGKVLFDLEIYRTIYETEAMRESKLLGHIINFDFTFGRADPRNDSKVPFFERFYAGGRDSIRGFDFRGMGPRENGDPIGGNAYAFTSIEYSYPLLVEFLRGAVFYDVACLSPDYGDLFHDKWRNTVGFGIRFIIPQLGNIPVALDFGFPLTKRSDDERQTVTLDIGKLF